MTTTLVIRNVRLAHPDLFAPREFEKGDGKFRYSETLLIVPGSENDKNIRKAIETECKAKFGVKWEQRMNAFMGDSNKCCYRDGNTKNDEKFADHMILAAHRRADDGAPIVVGKNPHAPIPQSERPYSGCYVNTKVEIYVQSGDYPGIRCSPLSVQFAGDGDAFAGRPPSEKDTEVFDNLAEGADADDEGDLSNF